MKFYEIVDQIIALLHSRGRLSYRALTVEFDLDDNSLVVLKEELIETQGLAVDKDGKMLVGQVGKETENRGNRDLIPAPSTQRQVPDQLHACPICLRCWHRPTAGEIIRATRDDEPCPPVAATAQAERSS